MHSPLSGAPQNLPERAGRRNWLNLRRVSEKFHPLKGRVERVRTVEARRHIGRAALQAAFQEQRAHAAGLARLRVGAMLLDGDLVSACASAAPYRARRDGIEGNFRVGSDFRFRLSGAITRARGFVRTPNARSTVVTKG
jgi:hypothetical protein